MDYRISIEETGEIARNINIDIARADFDRRIRSAVARTAPKIQLKGFRRGKVPNTMVEKLYGGQIRRDVLDEIWKDAYQSAVSEHSLKVVGLDDVRVDETKVGDDVRIVAQVSLLPQPALESYLGVKAEAEEESFTESMLEEELSALRRRAGKVEKIEDRDTAEAGDLANIAFSATVDGESFEGSETQNTFVEIGSGRSAAELEAGLVGMKKGESKNIDVPVPTEHADEKIRGKTAVHVVTLKDLLRVDLPALDDELAKKIGIGEDLSSLRMELEKRIRKSIDQRNREAKVEAVVKAIAEKNSFQVPQVMIDEEIREMLFELRALDPRKRESYQFDVSGFRDVLGEQAEHRVRRSIIVRRIVEIEQIESTEADCQAWIEKQAGEMEVSREEAAKHFGFPKEADRLKSMLSADRALDLILEKAKITLIAKKNGEDKRGKETKKGEEESTRGSAPKRSKK